MSTSLSETFIRRWSSMQMGFLVTVALGLCSFFVYSNTTNYQRHSHCIQTEDETLDLLQPPSPGTWEVIKRLRQAQIDWWAEKMDPSTVDNLADEDEVYYYDDTPWSLTEMVKDESLKINKQLRKEVSKDNIIKNLLKKLTDNKEIPVQELKHKNFSVRHQEDPSLISYVRQHLLIQPSIKPYNLSNPEKLFYSQYEQDQFAQENFLHGMVGGFFIEVGAYNGEDLSNTLYLEKNLNWTGLLIEPDPTEFNQLLRRNRKAYCINAGLSLTNYSGILQFGLQKVINWTVWKVREKNESGVPIQVFPLYTMLLALGVNQVDFFSLDVEGNEMEVMNTFPWDKVKVRLMLIETYVVKGRTKTVLKFLEGKGLIFLGQDQYDAWFGRRDLLSEIMDVDKYLKKHKIAQERKTILRGSQSTFHVPRMNPNKKSDT